MHNGRLLRLTAGMASSKNTGQIPESRTAGGLLGGLQTAHHIDVPNTHRTPATHKPTQQATNGTGEIPPHLGTGGYSREKVLRIKTALKTIILSYRLQKYFSLAISHWRFIEHKTSANSGFVFIQDVGTKRVPDEHCQQRQTL